MLAWVMNLGFAASGAEVITDAVFPLFYKTLIGGDIFNATIINGNIYVSTVITDDTFGSVNIGGDIFGSVR